ncbi:hypothetical protein ACROYT_G033839 [Oculina patagonica]
MAFKWILVVTTLLAVPLTAETGTCGLVKISGDRFQGTGKIHWGFSGAIRRMNSYAHACRVKIYVTSSFSKDGAGVVSGAVVKPSKISNHFVGHAIDINVIDGANFCNSTCLGDASKQTKAVKCFIFKIQGHGILRWGGDFAVPDPVHIDDGCNVRWRSVYDKMYKALQTNC